MNLTPHFDSVADRDELGLNIFNDILQTRIVPANRFLIE